MAKFYKHLGVICLQRNATDPRQAIPDSATDATPDFDPSTNAHVLDAFSGDYNSHSLSAGVLSRNGTPVLFAADSQDRQDKSDFDTQLSAFQAAMQTYLGIADAATNAQVRDQVKRLTQGMARVCKIIKLLRPQLEK